MPHLLNDPNEHRASIKAEKAWVAIKKADKKMLSDWLDIGQGFLTGRAWAMRKAETNAPVGRGYNEAFSEWLATYHLNDIDAAARSNLIKLMTTPEILQWRNSLSDDRKRESLNHPTRIVAAYNKRPRPASEVGEDGIRHNTARRQTSTELAAALNRIHEQDDLIRQLQARGGQDREQQIRDLGAADEATEVYDADTLQDKVGALPDEELAMTIGELQIAIRKVQANLEQLFSDDLDEDTKRELLETVLPLKEAIDRMTASEGQKAKKAKGKTKTRPVRREPTGITASE
jgi:hypothetical protein